MQTIGTCSLCGGPVQVPTHWAHPDGRPPQAQCANCGAVAEESYGPTIPMKPPGAGRRSWRQWPRWGSLTTG